ncbi:MAG TPA: thiamine phosphate synthase [Acidimicrobiales bacterium]|nr:thiamine phosphate synthase [Acidimicrobiales bacterium]
MTAGAVADRQLGRLHVLVDSLIVAEAALEAGAPTLQIRLKSGNDGDRFRLAHAIAERCRAAGATCLVNDRADLAVAVEADGVHVGADDLPVRAVRRVVGPDALVGGTARDPETGRRLVGEGASYLGVGPAYATASKVGLPDPIGVEGVRAVVEAVDVPVIAIAGITVARVDEVMAAGAYGVAVIGAVIDSPDPHTATHDLMLAVTKAVDALGGERG